MKKIKPNFSRLTPELRLYQIPVPIIGLTGGVGTGKTSVANLFREKNIPVIDADQLVKNIYNKPETKKFISALFPEAVIDENIHFKTLREKAFNDSKTLLILENYIYPLLKEEFIAAFRSFKEPSFIVYDVPLLFEKKLSPLVDLSLCVYAPQNIQIERIIKRDHCQEETAKSIIESQMPIEEKKLKADRIISNTSTLNALCSEFNDFFQSLIFRT